MDKNNVQARKWLCKSGEQVVMHRHVPKSKNLGGREVGLDRTGQMSFLTGQDRTPKFAGQVLPDQTESRLKHFIHQVWVINSLRIRSLDTNLVSTALLDQINKQNKILNFLFMFLFFLFLKVLKVRRPRRKCPVFGQSRF